MKPTEFTPKADSDFDQAIEYFAEEANEIVAVEFVDSVEQSLQVISSNPEIGALRPSLDPRLIGLRMWPVSRFDSYLIFYRETETHITVIRLLHGSRDISPEYFE